MASGKNSKVNALIDFVSAHQPGIISASQLEAEFREFIKAEGRSVHTFRTNTKETSQGGAEMYTRKLWTESPELQELMSYDLRSDCYTIFGGRRAAVRNDWSGGMTESRGGFSRGTGRTSSGHVLPAIGILLAAGISLFLIGKAVGAVRSFVSGTENYVSSNYEGEVFTWEGLTYVGDRQMDKPNDVCFRLDGPEAYTIGTFSKGKADTYAVSIQSEFPDVRMGKMKDGSLNGPGLRILGDTVYIASFKKGVPEGYGYCYRDGTESLVKFGKKASAYDFSDLEVIAIKNGELWYRESGKELKLRKGSYKGMEFPAPYAVTLDDDFYFELYPADEAMKFYHGDADIYVSREKIAYADVNDEKGLRGSRMIYEPETGKIEGEHYTEERTYTFTAEVN